MLSEETLNMLEDQIVKLTGWLHSADIDDPNREKVSDELKMLLEQRRAFDRDDLEFFDKQERRRIEEERNKATNDLEKEKQGINWKRALFEMAKVTVPVLIGWGLYSKESDKMYEFEETGRINSSVGRRHCNMMPRFLK